MRALIYLADTLGADAEGLIRLMAGGATAPICSQALKKGALFIDAAAGVECGDRTGLVLEMFEVRNEISQGS